MRFNVFLHDMQRWLIKKIRTLTFPIIQSDKEIFVISIKGVIF